MHDKGAKKIDPLAAFRSRADNLLVGALGFHLLLCMLVAVFTDSWVSVLTVGLPAFLVPLYLSRVAKGALVTRLAVACASMVFAALLIQQTHGVIEAHFSIFVLLAFLVLYCDWYPLLAAAALIVAHHAGFAWLQYGGAGVYVFPDVSGWNGVYRVSVHAFYVVVETGLLCYMAALLKGMIEDGIIVSTFAAQISEGRLDYDFAPESAQKEGDTNSLMFSLRQMQIKLVNTTSAIKDNASTLADQIRAFDGAANSYAETKSDADFFDLQRAVKKLGKTADILGKSIARFRL